MFKNYDSQIKDAQRRDAEAFERLVSEDRKALDQIKIEEQRKLCEYRRELAKVHCRILVDLLDYVR